MTFNLNIIVEYNDMVSVLSRRLETNKHLLRGYVLCSKTSKNFSLLLLVLVVSFFNDLMVQLSYIIAQRVYCQLQQ